GVFDLALVPDIDPGGAEDAFHLQLEDGGIGVELAVHATGCDQAGKLGIDVSHRLIPRRLPCGRGGDHCCVVGPDRALSQMIAHSARRSQALLRSGDCMSGARYSSARPRATSPSDRAMPFSCDPSSPSSTLP